MKLPAATGRLPRAFRRACVGSRERNLRNSVGKPAGRQRPCRSGKLSGADVSEVTAVWDKNSSASVVLLSV